MANPTRRTCPSCQTRLSPLAAECPECGLALAPARQGRPLLFQASALAQVTYDPPPKALTAPALGRVAPVAVDVHPDELDRSPGLEPAPATSMHLAAWVLVTPYLVAVSWLLFMAPLVLTGQTPMMGYFGVTLPENTPERRMAFSVVHLLSVLCFPLSFLCMVLSPRHQTLAELLSGQELLSRPLSRMR